MLDHSNIGKLGRVQHNTDLFVGVVRNIHAVARSDNPNSEKDNETYKAARSQFITDTLAMYEGTQVPVCKDCGIEMSDGYHIHHCDGDHTNNDPANFEINCPFCHLTKHLGWIGANGLGTIVYAPNIPQATLNQIQIACYAHEYILNETSKTAKHYALIKKQSHHLRLYLQSLESTKAIIQRDFKTTDPLHFANAFLQMSEDEYAARTTGTFSGIRLLFDSTQFQSEIEKYAKFSLSMDDTASPNHPAQWIAQAKQIR
ncbi:conserved hypothetical protein [Vibrio nigripulchritudo SOn1]|uniref:HNH endonuclease n=1 Tax=Vibrio nigripulchritudo SOn1 TaxID=1238450 RepID=A0AAV2VQ84_9VIBR|nr:hypothetical protein [Vibrio nigripulchritudo]CCO46804.1 conserved hypothetical protein [Vibrio nigripulchritudo SOn1]